MRQVIHITKRKRERERKVMWSIFMFTPRLWACTHLVNVGTHLMCYLPPFQSGRVNPNSNLNWEILFHSQPPPPPPLEDMSSRERAQEPFVSSAGNQTAPQNTCVCDRVPGAARWMWTNDRLVGHAPASVSMYVIVFGVGFLLFPSSWVWLAWCRTTFAGRKMCFLNHKWGSRI